MTLERANQLFKMIEKHIGAEIPANDCESWGVHQHDDGSVSFHTEDRSLTLILYPEANVVARRERHGQQRYTSLHRDGECLGGWRDLGSKPTSN
jgi:hypothetical protein